MAFRHTSPIRLSGFAIAVIWLFLSAAPASAMWAPAQAENLARWIERASDEGLEMPAGSASAIRTAIDAGHREDLNEVASDAAMMLLRGWRGQCCGASRPAWWHIDGSMADGELREGLETALRSGTLDLYLRSVRPSHPQYEALIAELENETDPTKRSILKANLARWRWLPSDLGERYLLANIASQHLTLWDDRRIVGRWRVIIGKPVTRTPVFTAQVSGVVLNPWWEIPSSIAAEGIASFVRRSPAAARARGYVYQNGRYRQMPGDNNALGRMKLVMPNPYSVFLHDTSNRELFAEDRRAFSHGCIRVDRALSFASVLLSKDGWTRERIAEEVETNRTQTIPLARPVPLFVTYFTAERAPSGEVRYYEDIYRRDPVVLSPQASADTDIYGSLLRAEWTRLDGQKEHAHVRHYLTRSNAAQEPREGDALFQRGSEGAVEDDCIDAVRL